MKPADRALRSSPFTSFSFSLLVLLLAAAALLGSGCSAKLTETEAANIAQNVVKEQIRFVITKDDGMHTPLVVDVETLKVEHQGSRYLVYVKASAQDVADEKKRGVRISIDDRSGAVLQVEQFELDAISASLLE